MAAPRAVIFDLGGTLVHWSDWETGADRKWANSYDHLVTQFADRKWPARDAYVNAMRDAEREHWRRVDTEHWSGPPTGLVREAFDRLGVPVSGAELLGAMDGYAKAIAGWSTVDPDAATVLKTLRDRGYRLGLLSNTWWAATGTTPISRCTASRVSSTRSSTRPTSPTPNHTEACSPKWRADWMSLAMSV